MICSVDCQSEVETPVPLKSNTSVAYARPVGTGSVGVDVGRGIGLSVIGGLTGSSWLVSGGFALSDGVSVDAPLLPLGSWALVALHAERLKAKTEDRNKENKGKTLLFFTTFII